MMMLKVEIELPMDKTLIPATGYNPVTKKAEHYFWLLYTGHSVVFQEVSEEEWRLSV
jgi:hypothetical protein